MHCPEYLILFTTVRAALPRVRKPMKIKKVCFVPDGRSILAVVAAMAVGVGMSTASLAAGDARQFDPVLPPVAESYDEQLAEVIDRTQRDAAFASQVRNAGPEAYPLLVLIAADYNFNSPEYRRYLQQRTKGGRN